MPSTVNNQSNSKIIPSPLYEKVISIKCRPNLKIYADGNKDSNGFYIYYLLTKQNRYLCLNCQKLGKCVSATLQNDKDGEYVQLGKTSHVCQPCVSSVIYTLKIIKKPGFEKVKNRYGNPNLKIFTTDYRTSGEFYLYCYHTKNNRYYCIDCREFRNVNSATFHKDEEKEYVKLRSVPHIHQPRGPPVIDPSRIIKHPGFEKIKSYQGNPALKINAPNEKIEGSFYIYLFRKIKNQYACNGCRELGKHVHALLLNDSNNEEYVQLCKAPHVCKPRIPDVIDPSRIIRRPGFETCLSQHKKHNIKVFLPGDKNCYYQYYHDTKANIYFCSDCSTKHNKSVRATLEADDKGEYMLLGTTPHICQYRKTVADKSKVVCKDLFEKFTSDRDVPNIQVFTSKEKVKYYFYFYDKQKKKYLCSDCRKKKVHVTAKLQNNKENEEEYLLLGDKQHECKPRNINGYPDDPSKIIYLPGYEKYTTKNDKPGLFVYASGDRTLFYKYYYDSSSNHYTCSQCQFLHKYVNATLELDKKGIEYIKRGNADHVCKPLQTNDQDTIIYPSRYEKTTSRNGNSVLKIYTSDAKTHFYWYPFKKEKQYYYCAECNKLGKTITAKLEKNENGVECVNLVKTEHVCKPQNI